MKRTSIRDFVMAYYRLGRADREQLASIVMIARTLEIQHTTVTRLLPLITLTVNEDFIIPFSEIEDGYIVDLNSWQAIIHSALEASGYTTVPWGWDDVYAAWQTNREGIDYYLLITWGPDDETGYRFYVRATEEEIEVLVSAHTEACEAAHYPPE